MTASIQPYLSGQKLYGDDFAPDEIADWYADEREGYAGLAPLDDVTAASYGYHALNERHLFRHLPSGQLGSALGLGAAFGGEFRPIAHRLDSITILEPSVVLRGGSVAGVPLTYVDPKPDGAMPAPDDSIDLVTSLGVLHHIPNVSRVVCEVARVLRPGGYFLLREPAHSMGDWRQPRAGLTKRERGIPRAILLDILGSAGLETQEVTWCDSPIMSRYVHPNSSRGVLLDELVSRALAWNYRYHAESRWQKVRPRSLAVVARRP